MRSLDGFAILFDALDEATLPKAFVLRGLTGVGKTLVLRELERIRPGWTLDLEGHAQHRSSILGMIGLEPVGQKAFESDIATRLRAGFPADLVVYEGESRKVGDRIVPERVWDSLITGKNPKLTTTVERRVEALALRRDARATHDRLDREGAFGQTGGELLSLAEDLRAELAGAAQDERTHRVGSAGERRGVIAQQTLDSRHEKRKGLACAGLRLGEHLVELLRDSGQRDEAEALAAKHGVCNDSDDNSDDGSV